MMFFRDNKNKIIIILITLILIVSMASSVVDRQSANFFTDSFGTVMTPFQSFFTYIGNCFKYASDAEKFEDENTNLKQQVIILEKKVKDYDELKEENQRLTAMLELQKNNVDYSLKAADVISYSFNNWSSVLRINKGLSDGLKKNDAVITEVGLVGYISEIGRNWADVTTIIDSETAVAAVVDRIDEKCIVHGDMAYYEDGFCVMKYVTTESSISIGDMLVTSGEGGIYPKGISIGKITEISTNLNGLSQDAVIEPMVDFSKINEVFVIVK